MIDDLIETFVVTLPNGGGLDTAVRQRVEARPLLAGHRRTLIRVSESLEALEVSDLADEDEAAVRPRILQARLFLEKAILLLRSTALR